MATFRFEAQWKETLACRGPGGSFALELTMGAPGVYLPPKEEWELRGPSWAHAMWPVLKQDLEQWCAKNELPLYIEGGAQVWA